MPRKFRNTIIVILLYFAAGTQAVCFPQQTNPIDNEFYQLLQQANDALNVGHWQEAEKANQQALGFLEATSLSENEKAKQQTHIMLHQAYIHLVYAAEYNTSLDLLVKVLKRAQENKDTVSYMTANRYLGFNYRFLSDYNKSIGYLEEAMRVAKLIEDTTSYLTALNEKANNLLLMEKYDEAELCYLEALEHARSIGYDYGITFISHDLGFLYQKKKQYRKALNCFMTTFELDQQANNNRDLCISSANVAVLYLELGKKDSALFYFKKAEHLALESNLKTEELNIYDNLSSLYNENKNYQKAFEYSRKYIALKDSIFSAEKEKQIAEINASFESEKKEKENEMLKQQNTIQELQIEKGENRYTYTVIIAVLIIVFIGLFAFTLYRNIQIRKKINQELREANTTKDKFFSIIAHDIKNPFSSILGFSELLDSGYNELTLDQKRKYVSAIAESSKHLFKLLENLLQWSRSQSGKINCTPEVFDLHELIECNLTLYKNSALRKEISLNFKRGRKYKIYADRSMVDGVIRNLLSNAIKFTPKRGRIEIVVGSEGSMAKIGIKDNGVGIKPDDMKKLFHIDSQVKTKGTENESGTGLGLIICKEFVEANGGQLWAESEPGKGSVFNFTIPIKV